MILGEIALDEEEMNVVMPPAPAASSRTKSHLPQIPERYEILCAGEMHTNAVCPEVRCLCFYLPIYLLKCPDPNCHNWLGRVCATVVDPVGRTEATGAAAVVRKLGCSSSWVHCTHRHGTVS